MQGSPVANATPTITSTQGKPTATLSNAAPSQSNETTVSTLQLSITDTQIWCEPLYVQLVSRTKLQDLVREVDAAEQLDEEVEDLLLQLADDFVESTVNAACLLAKHRKATTVEVRDVQLHLGELVLLLCNNNYYL